MWTSHTSTTTTAATTDIDVVIAAVGTELILQLYHRVDYIIQQIGKSGVVVHKRDGQRDVVLLEYSIVDFYGHQRVHSQGIQSSRVVDVRESGNIQNEVLDFAL